MHGMGAAREDNRSRKRCALHFHFNIWKQRASGLRRTLVNDSSSAHKTKALRCVLKVQAELMVWRLFSSLRWAE